MVFMVDLSKAKPCSDCGLRFPAVCMDYDHRGDKTRDVSAFANNAVWRRAFAEMTKCDLVCANCHRIRTHGRRAGQGITSTGAEAS